MSTLLYLLLHACAFVPSERADAYADRLVLERRGSMESPLLGEIAAACTRDIIRRLVVIGQC